MRHEETLARASGRSTSRFDFSGEWANELTSTMDVIQQASVVTGVYTSQVSSEGRTPLIGQLAGYAHGDLISFTVKWDTMAITAWVGRRREEDGEDVIETLWQMTTMSDDGENGFWHSIFAGADRFTRTTVLSRSEQPLESEAGDMAKAPAG